MKRLQNYFGPGAASSGGSTFTGKYLKQSLSAGVTSLNNTGVSGAIVLMAMSLENACQFSRIVQNVNGNDTNHSNLYDFGLYDTTGALLANVGARFLDPVGVRDLPFVQGTVSFPAGEYIYAFTGAGPAATLASIEISNTRGLYFAYTTIASSAPSGNLPSSIAIVESAAQTGFGGPPNTPLIVLY